MIASKIKEGIFLAINKRENLSIYPAFLSLILFSIRVRGGDFDRPVFIVENLLFCAAIAVFPWTHKQLKVGALVLVGLALHTAAATWMYYNNPSDWAKSSFLFATTSKCILFALLLANFDYKKMYLTLKVSMVLILAYQIAWFEIFGRDINFGLSIGMGDRNYFALLELFLLFSIHLLHKKNQINQKFDLVLINIFNIAIFILIVLSGSRTGIIGIVFVLLLFYGWRGIIVMSLLLVISHYLGYTEQLEYRFRAEVIGGKSNDDIRLAQYYAFLNTFIYYPLGILTGFGTMASSHLDWFSQFYKGYESNLQRYLYIQHNSILDLIISFGIGGVYLLWRLASQLNWKILIFIFICMSFNNVLNFLPFYVFLGILGSMRLLYKSKVRLRENAQI
jgi:hypothetical protein